MAAMTEAPFPDPSRLAPDAHDHLRQAILNEREIPDRARQRRWTAPRRVTARVVWETDGDELRETSATHWAHVAGETIVLVVLTDRRRRTIGVWLGLDDVTPSAQQ